VGRPDAIRLSRVLWVLMPSGIPWGTRAWTKGTSPLRQRRMGPAHSCRAARWRCCTRDNHARRRARTTWMARRAAPRLRHCTTLWARHHGGPSTQTRPSVRRSAGGSLAWAGPSRWRRAVRRGGAAGAWAGRRQRGRPWGTASLAHWLTGNRSMTITAPGQGAAMASRPARRLASVTTGRRRRSARAAHKAATVAGVRWASTATTGWGRRWPRSVAE
jgi:hypothetical protein